MSNAIQVKLRAWAVGMGMPHMLAAENLEASRDSIAILLVGSVATGLCREGSDVDLAILCDNEMFERISKNKPWSSGRPTEMRLDGVQLHYYAISIENVLALLHRLDDGGFYVYGTANVLLDPSSLYENRIAPVVKTPEHRKERLEGKLDMLLRRSKALAACSKEPTDLLVLARMSLEVISLAMKVAALIDNVPFDPRKRFMETALAGPLGQQLKQPVTEMLSHASRWREGEPGNEPFLRRLAQIREVLSVAAAKDGYAVGLPRPDHRACEQ